MGYNDQNCSTVRLFLSPEQRDYMEKNCAFKNVMSFDKFSLNDVANGVKECSDINNTLLSSLLPKNNHINHGVIIGGIVDHVYQDKLNESKAEVVMQYLRDEKNYSEDDMTVRKIISGVVDLTVNNLKSDFGMKSPLKSKSGKSISNDFLFSLHYNKKKELLKKYVNENINELVSLLYDKKSYNFITDKYLTTHICNIALHIASTVTTFYSYSGLYVLPCLSSVLRKLSKNASSHHERVRAYDVAGMYIIGKGVTGGYEAMDKFITQEWIEDLHEDISDVYFKHPRYIDSKIWYAMVKNHKNITDLLGKVRKKKLSGNQKNLVDNMYSYFTSFSDSISKQNGSKDFWPSPWTTIELSEKLNSLTFMIIKLITDAFESDDVHKLVGSEATLVKMIESKSVVKDVDLFSMMWLIIQFSITLNYTSMFIRESYGSSSIIKTGKRLMPSTYSSYLDPLDTHFLCFSGNMSILKDVKNNMSITYSPESDNYINYYSNMQLNMTPTSEVHSKTKRGGLTKSVDNYVVYQDCNDKGLFVNCEKVVETKTSKNILAAEKRLQKFVGNNSIINYSYLPSTTDIKDESENHKNHIHVSTAR